MARDLRLSIGGDSSGGQRSLEELALASEVAAREADHLADEFKKAKRDAADLDRQLAETAAATRALATELSKDPGSDALKKKLDEQKKAAAELKKLRQDVVGDTEKDAKAAAAVAKTAADELAKASSAAKRAAEDIATAEREAEAGAKSLKTRIDELEKSLKHAGAALAQNASPSLLAKFRSDSSELAGLKSTVSELKKLGVEVEKFGNLGQGLESLGGLGEALGPALPVIGAGIAVPALAGVGGAIGAGAGLGAVGLGAAGAVMGNPEKFQAAWSSATSAVKAELIDASQPFEGPLLDAIASVGPLVKSWHLGETLANASKYVKPLADGLSSFASSVVHGFSALADNAGPEVEAVANGFVRLGNAADDALTNISKGSEGGAQALKDMFTVLAGGVEAFGAVTLAAEDTFSFIHDHPIEAAISTGGLSLGITAWNALADATDHTTSKLVDVKKDTDDVSIAFGTLDQQAAAAASMLERMNRAYDQQISDALDLNKANVAVAQGFADLTKNFERGSGALDIHTQRGRDNITTIDNMVEALQRQRDAQIAEAGGTQAATAAANKAYDAQLAKLGDMLVKLGNNRSAVDALLGSFKDKTFTVTQKVVTVYEHIGSVSSEGVISGGVPRLAGSAYAHGGIRRAAAGMIVPPRNPGTILMGEPSTGGEALIPLGSSISDSGAMALAGTVGRAHGFAVSSYGSSGGSRDLILHATFLDPQTGETMRKQTIRWSLDHGRDPATATAF